MPRLLNVFAAIAAFWHSTTAAMAQDWPTRPITMVVATLPGGAPDILGRVLAARMSELLGQQLIVENVGGAGGTLGAVRVAKAAPDGLQLLIGTVGTQAQSQALNKSLPYNPVTDFEPVSLLWQVEFLLTVRKDLLVENLRDFIAYAKVNQSRMNYGSGGVGSPPHLACALINTAAGINVTHVPYRGVSAAVQDLVGGRIDYACPSATSALGNVESKQIKALVLLSRERSSLLPQIPTVNEQGLSDFEATGWSGMFLPKGTPAPIIKKLNGAVATALDTPAVQTRFREVGAEIAAPERRSPEYLQKFVESEITKWTAAIKAAGIAAK
jgi:tripartite-type tricarboxylate transporter receptor subunit TctC